MSNEDQERAEIHYDSDKHGTVTGLARGHKVAVLWGPAVDNGEWFVHLKGWPEARRVATREAGVALLPTSWPPLAASPLSEEKGASGE